MQKLLVKCLFGCETIRQKRKHFPKSKLAEDKTLAMGKSDFAVCKKISVTKWKDRGKKAVDRFDRCVAAYNVSWKSRRWWLKLWYYFLDASIVNSYLLYRKTLKLSNPRRKPLGHLQFRSKLADQLIGQFVPRQRPGPPPTPTVFSNINDLPKKSTLWRCKHCADRGKQKRSSVCCSEC